MSDQIKKYIKLVENNSIVDVPTTKFFVTATVDGEIKKFYINATDEIHAEVVLSKKKPGAVINSIRKATASTTDSITDEGYSVVPGIDHNRYTDLSSEGLEGPFRLKSGKVVYYDPKVGRYYDRDTDIYLDNDEYDIHNK